MHLKIGEKDYIILDSWEAVHEIMEKQSANYSDRLVLRHPLLCVD